MCTDCITVNETVLLYCPMLGKVSQRQAYFGHIIHILTHMIARRPSGCFDNKGTTPLGSRGIITRILKPRRTMFITDSCKDVARTSMCISQQCSVYIIRVTLCKMLLKTRKSSHDCKSTIIIKTIINQLHYVL